MIRDVESLHKCKDCGKDAYSYQIGWEDNDGVIHWHSPRHFKQCKKCRNIMYQKIVEKKRYTKDEDSEVNKESENE